MLIGKCKPSTIAKHTIANSLLKVNRDRTVCFSITVIHAVWYLNGGLATLMPSSVVKPGDDTDNRPRHHSTC